MFPTSEILPNFLVSEILVPGHENLASKPSGSITLNVKNLIARVS